MKRLRKYKKVEIKSGDTEKVKFELTKNDLAFFNKELKLVSEPGTFEVMIKDLTARFEYVE